ncbi:MAG: hypothetical protein BroJett011_41620 [Chloroflexota bacterium]|nr:MAG: hypothetical protein BroJett011_41620 [Chloroflexota bacterium]
MKRNLRNFTGRVVNASLGMVNLKLVQRNNPYTDYRDYIPFEETLAGANEAGLSVGDYIDVRHNKPGATQETIDQMAALGVFRNKIERVCEIGPGSGRYLDKTLQACNPAYYEIYETAGEWEKWLVQKYKVTSHPTDGKSLAYTPSCSIDLVQAHKVLPGQPSLTICRYFVEMARVVRDGGKVVFDVVTEDCLDNATLEQWFVADGGYQHYPCLMPKQYTIDFFCERHFSFDGSFLVPMAPGKTECLVFTKQPS